jgi:hypothetical protein
MDAKRGDVIDRCRARHRAREFRRFLNRVDANVPSNLDVNLIIDNYGTHNASTVRRSLAGHLRYHGHLTPTGASWLTLVERWCAELEPAAIASGESQRDRRTDRYHHGL